MQAGPVLWRTLALHCCRSSCVACMPYGDSLSPEDVYKTLRSKPLPRKALHAVLVSLLQQA